MSEISEKAKGLIDNLKYREYTARNTPTRWNKNLEKTARAELNNYIAEIEARMAELEAIQRWIPVSERLPELGKVVVVHDANDIPYFTRQDLTYAVAVLIEKNNVKMFGFIEEFSVWYSSDVTHWMQLPEPPEVQL